MKISTTAGVQNPGTDNSVPPLIRMGNEDPFYFEQIKALRAKLEYKVDGLNLRVIAVTSAISGEGKTLSCANLAVNLASAGRKKVLLIDADMRKADLGRGMDVHTLPGLSEFIAGTVDKKDILRETTTPGLRMIPAGTRIANPTDLLAGDMFRSFLRQTREQYDVILLDTPPVLPVADTLTLRDQVDGFLFLFRAGFTPRTMLSQAVEEVGEQKVIGVVLNGVETRGQRYYDRYYGGYYRGPHKEEPTE